MRIRNEWRDQLLKEYAEQEFEDDGTMLEINIDTGDDDECCEMIKRKYNPKVGKDFNNRYGEDCNQLKLYLEKNAYELVPDYATFTPKDPEAARRRMAKYKAIVEEWDECEMKKNSWKTQLE
jgi:hypothetical protein